MTVLDQSYIAGLARPSDQKLVFGRVYLKTSVGIAIKFHFREVPPNGEKISCEVGVANPSLLLYWRRKL